MDGALQQTLPTLGHEERHILRLLARSRGHFVISGLGPRAMAGLATAVLRLHRAGLVHTDVHVRGVAPQVIPMELTDTGRRLAETER